MLKWWPCLLRVKWLSVNVDIVLLTVEGRFTGLGQVAAGAEPAAAENV